MTDADLIAFLDDISACFLIPDFGLWQSRVSLPLSLVTKDGPVMLTTTAELRENFNAYLKACDIMGLDTILRHPISIEDCRDGTFIATYRTDLMRGTTHEAPPYTSSALIRHTGGTWRMSSILNARGHHDWTGELPITKGETDA